MRGILKSNCGTSASNVPRTCALSDPETLANNTTHNARPPSNPCATSIYKRPIIKRAGRRNVSFSHQHIASTWPDSRQQNRRSKSRDLSNFAAASMKEWKWKTQGLRKGIKQVEHMQNSLNYSVGSFPSPDVS